LYRHATLVHQALEHLSLSGRRYSVRFSIPVVTEASSTELGEILFSLAFAVSSVPCRPRQITGATPFVLRHLTNIAVRTFYFRSSSRTGMAFSATFKKSTIGVLEGSRFPHDRP